jgi:hypothetical protein
MPVGPHMRERCSGPSPRNITPGGWASQSRQRAMSHQGLHRSGVTPLFSGALGLGEPRSGLGHWAPTCVCRDRPSEHAVPLPGHRRRPVSARAYPVPSSDPGPAPSPDRARQAAMHGLRPVVRGRLDGPRGRTVTEMFDGCQDAVTPAGARRRASPGDRATSRIGG